jgi:hypothetical protein
MNEYGMEFGMEEFLNGIWETEELGMEFGMEEFLNGIWETEELGNGILNRITVSVTDHFVSACG